MRSLGIKRCIKTLGRSGKRLGARIPHQHNIAAIKAARKRIGKVIGKRNQTIAGTYNPQLRQRRRHMRGRNKTHPTRADPCSPGLF